MLFYFQFFYSFPFNVISVATVLCFCGFHPPVVSTFSWFPPFHGFHPVWLLCGLHPPVVCIFPWLLCGVPFMVYTLLCVSTLPSWFPPSPVVTPWCPFRGSHFCGLHSAVVSTLPWFASLHGSHPPCGYFVVSLSWFAPSRGLHSAVVSTLPWFASLRGSHPPCGYFMVSLSWFAPSRGLHSAVVSTLPWFASSRGSHPLVVTPWCPSWILA